MNEASKLVAPEVSRMGIRISSGWACKGAVHQYVGSASGNPVSRLIWQ